MNYLNNQLLVQFPWININYHCNQFFKAPLSSFHRQKKNSDYQKKSSVMWEVKATKPVE